MSQLEFKVEARCLMCGELIYVQFDTPTTLHELKGVLVVAHKEEKKCKTTIEHIYICEIET